MENNALVSIALCTFNGAKFLKEQLDSLVNQSYPDLEIIAVDDASQDHTFSILKEYASKYPMMRVYRNEKNLGFQNNFEKALKLCKGDFIAISDQDDIWNLNKIQWMYEKIRGNLLIYHDSEMIDTFGNSLNMKISEKINFIRGNNCQAFFLMNCVSGHSVFFKKQLLNYAFPFPKKGIYDHWLALVATHYGYIDYIDKCLVKYRQHGRNVTDFQGIRTKSSANQKLKLRRRLKRENEWLEICAQFQVKQRTKEKFAVSLYSKAKQRTSNYINFMLGFQIWKHRKTLLAILKENSWSKFCFALRHIWGWKIKSLFKT
jgi:glycosyltransferase involved in cell wall biosynthesis